MIERPTGRNEPFIDDDPTAQDLLGRTHVARNLSALIENAPAGSSFRLGIYGGWGEGKTSIMRMMAARLTDAGIGTAVVLPWMSRDADSLTTDIVDAITTAIGSRTRSSLRKATGTAGTSLAEGWTELASTDWKLKLLDKTIVGAIRKGTAALEEWQDGKVLQSITEYLRDKKLVVFVDDVDRTDPGLVPKLLLNLREALSLPNLFYVIGLSPAVVQEGLKEAHPGYSDALRFLEKIVEYPFFLPPLTAIDCARFAQAFARSEDCVDRDVLASIASLLPRNPRQLKLFIRTLALLAPQWRRFERDEISLSAAYLVQLLALEFPHESRLLANCDADIEWIEKYQIRQISERMNARRGGGSETDATNRIPATAGEIQDAARRTRYIELCSAIGNRVPLTSTYRVRDMLALTHQPPLLTWKEFSGILGDATHQSPVDVLRRWIESDDEHASGERQRVLFSRSVEYRSRVWGAIVDASTHAEMAELLKDLDTAMELLLAQVRDLRGFDRGILTADEWSLLRKHFAETSRFGRPKDLYRDRRAAEVKLIAHALDNAPNNVKGEVFLRVRHADDYGFMEEPPVAYTKTIATIRRSCEESVAETLVARFEKPDGVELLWQEGTPERAVAFDDTSLFHTRDLRRRFYAVLQRSTSDTAIQKNALTFLRMVDYGALNNNSSLPMAACRRLLGDYRFVEQLWRAATANRLNFRTVGSLRHQRKVLTGVLSVPEKHLPLPKWWGPLEREFEQIEAAEAARKVTTTVHESDTTQEE